MRLATFDRKGQDQPEIGVVVEGDAIVSLSRAAPNLAHDMRDLIARWPLLESEVRRIAEEKTHLLTIADVHLLAPVPRPGKIMAIGLNYADHIAESGAETPTSQIWFAKQATSANAPFDPIEAPSTPSFVDYEAELVVIVGAGGRRLTRETAKEAVFGLCVGNDVTERSWQFRSSQWLLGKSFDTHAPFGPWITTLEDVPDPHGLDIRGLVNGEVRQASNTRHLVFDVWDQLVELSYAMTLEPGDLIFTGTPGGIGAAMKPPRFLQPGDVVRIEIEGLGAIENTVKTLQ